MRKHLKKLAVVNMIKNYIIDKSWMKISLKYKGII